MRRAVLLCCLAVAVCAASIDAQPPGEAPQFKGSKKGKGSGRGFGFGPPPVAVSSSPGQWEYAVKTAAEIRELGNADIQAGLNKLGDDGWELITLDGTFGRVAGHAYFKRPKTHRPTSPLVQVPVQGDTQSISFGNVASRQTKAAQAKETTTIVPVKNSNPLVLSQILQSVYARSSQIRFVPDQRTNRLILVAPEDQVAEIKRLIDDLDQPAPTERRMVK